MLAGDSTTVTIAFNVDTAYMGIAITNNVEITAATNALGLIDEDGNLLTVDGSANDTRELTTNDEYSDEYSNAPGTIDDISDVDDYDPEMITVVQEFDLALIKRLASAIPGSFMQNSIVTFDLTVFNQGTVHATNIILTDYIPSGLILDDSNWGANGTVGPATTSRKIGDIVAGDSTTVSIKFIVDSSFMGTIITNNAEITAATNASGLTDHDGALITIHGTSNDTSELATNNEYSDEYINAPGTADNTSDVDDYDLEQIVIDQEFDLALVEKLNASTPGPFMPGSTVKYDIILYNQGTLGASDIQITDYIPTGLVLNDANWSGNGKSGPDTTVRTIASLPAGDSTTITINFIVGNVFMGTIITNNTEITSAANSLGMVDEDGDLAIVNGSADDITELSTDNEYSDEYTNAPGIVDNALDADDYDPVQITVGQEFDLALTKKLNTLSPGPFIPGSTVMYDITVYNQGTMDATDITITDYIGTGLVLNDSNWSGNGTSGPDTTTRTIASLSARGSATVTIAFTIDSSFMDTLITNNAEITAANNALSLVDEDDDLANINGNADDTSELSTDDEYSDEYLNAPGTTDNASDYDDYDPAQITVNQTFDLALVKKLDSSTPGPFMQGSAVAYKITIYNQGTLDATKIEVTDYIPTGLMLSDSNWSGIGVIGPTTTVDTIAFLSAGDSTTLSISFVISSNFMDTLITNNAEITAAFNALGLTDEDGDLLNVNGNSGDISELGSDNDYSDDDENAPGDEDNELDVDDYDPAQIVINQEFDLALVKNLAESGPIFSGDTVTFNITVYNQGTMDATGVVITDYVPTGMTNVDPDWIGNTFSIGNLASGDSITVAIDLKVSENFMEASMTNNAEITSASNTLSLEDEDGAITTINGTVDDMSEITTDDDVDDESPGTPGTLDNPADADDYDPAMVFVNQDFDLALTKDLVTLGPYEPGDSVTFNITVYNQGTLDATNVQITEYPATGMINIDPEWAGNTFTISSLNAGASIAIPVDLRISQQFAGMQMVNNAEITTASNVLGIADSDGPLTIANGSADDISETDSDNDIDDEAVGTPGTFDNPNDFDDYDGASMTITLIHDLAIRIIVADSLSNQPAFGDSLKYDIEIYNQGNVGIDSIRITDYLPSGLSLINDNVLNAGWNATDVNNPVYEWGGMTLLAGEADTISIYVTIVQPITFSANQFTNSIELSYARDLAGIAVDTLDIDSELNNDPNDNGGGLPGTAADNELTGDGTSTSPDGIAATDQDNTDAALVEILDIALMTVLDSANLDLANIAYGDTIPFLIIVENQGNIVVDSVVVFDYLAAGYSFNPSLPNNALWTDLGNNTLRYSSSKQVLSGERDTLGVDLILEAIDLGLTGDSWVNYSEIAEIYDTVGNEIGSKDIDSSPGSHTNEEKEIAPNGLGDNDLRSSGLLEIGAEDDHDPAGIEVFDLALTKSYNSSFNPVSNPLLDGDTVKFDIIVWNQGNIPATSIGVNDTFPCGLVPLAGIGDFDALGNLTIADTILPGTNRLYCAYFQVLRNSSLPPDCNGNLIYDNYAEIISAFDTLGDAQDDIDSNPNSGSTQEFSVLPNSTGDNDIMSTSASGMGSEDDHDPANLSVFDLALTKKVASSPNGSSFVYGDTIKYVINLLNQGNIPTDSISIVDYIPDGLVFLPSLNQQWSDIGGNKIQWDTTETEGLEPMDFMLGDSLEVSLFLELRPSSMNDAFVNVAEISGARDTMGTILMADNDSRFDTNAMNDAGGMSMSAADNATGGSGTGNVGDGYPLTDEDDSDPASLMVVDMAIANQIDSAYSQTPFAYGDTIKFDMRIVNQGNVLISDIEISDYLPAGYLFDTSIPGNSNWKLTGSVVKRTLLNTNLDMNQDTVVSIYLILQPSTEATGWENIAEVSNIKDPLGNVLDHLDIDSQIDDNPSNNVGNSPNSAADDYLDGDGSAVSKDGVATTDQDNVDPALIEIFDLALRKELVSTGPFQYGDTLHFNLTIFNQGNLDAKDIQLTDHKPDGFIYDVSLHSYNDPWGNNMVAGPGDLMTTITGTIPAQSSSVVPLYLKFVESNIPTNKSWINYAEITNASDTNGNDISGGNLIDIDSEYNSNSSQENAIVPEDPGDDDISSTRINGIGSEDDHDPAGFEICDLALKKVLTNTQPINYGDTLKFGLIVFNQGGDTVKNVTITEYINTGYTFSSSNLPLWTFLPNGNAQTIITTELAPTDSITKTIDLIVNQGAHHTQLVNGAEISLMQNSSGQSLKDFDSTPDDSENNDGTVTDDEIDNSNGDEDDHDISIPPVFDLALKKSIEGDINSLAIGSQIEYRIDVFNQGNIDATSIEIADFADGALVFDPALNLDWKQVGDHFEYTGDLNVAAGESGSIFITMTVLGPISLNVAEIISARDNLGALMDDNDIDSTPDVDDGNDVGGLPGTSSDDNIDDDGSLDEDDHDPAFLVICTDLVCNPPINISVASECEPLVTPDLILLDSAAFPDSSYIITYFDESGNELSMPEFNQKNKVMIELIHCPDKRCWTDVFFEDKIGPTLNCTDDTIFCYELPNYVPPLISEGCGNFDLKIVNETIETVCSDSIIKKLSRTYTATDAAGNVSNTCTQNIFIKLWDINKVTFPQDTVLSCENPLVAGKASLPIGGFGVPMLDTIDLRTIIGDTCRSHLQYSDILILNTPCKKQFMRTWKVIQWLCTGEREREFVQLITIRDTVAPQINMTLDTIKAFATGSSCTAALDLPGLSVTDNCDEIPVVMLSSAFDHVIHSAGEQLNLPPGVHRVDIQAIDTCHNTTIDSFFVNVSDEGEPLALCLKHTVVSMNGNMEINVNAKEFDAGSMDACAGGVDMSVRRVNAICNVSDTTFADYVKFCCVDVGSEVMVVLRVTDQNGQFNECMVVVEVQDKATPELACPPDLMVTCALVIPNNDIFGNVVSEGQQQALAIAPSEVLNSSGSLVDGVVFGNCLDSIFVENTENLNQCGLGTITRKFTALNQSNLTNSCKQTITIVDDGSIKQESITYPLDVVINGCLDTNDLATLDTGVPEVFESKCDLIGFAFLDKVTVLNGTNEQGCLKVVRTWKAFNMCSVNKEIIGSHDQFITLSDTIDPIFESCADSIQKFTLFSPCVNGEIQLSKTASDNCTSPDEILWEVNVDVNNDGSFEHSITPTISVDSGQSVATVTIPVELQDNKVQWVINDQCGNKAVCEEILRVDGAATPSAICITSLTADLTDNGSGEQVVVWADEFDIGSSTLGCKNVVELVYSFSSSGVVASRTFTCADIGAQNIEVFLLAVDLVTNAILDSNSCHVNVIITDSDSSCQNMNMSLIIDGNVESHRGGTMSNTQMVLVDVASNNAQIQFTDRNGEYVFEDVFDGRNYRIYPHQNSNWRNGVSTLDLILIQNHILQKEKLPSGFDLMAADANNDQSISAIDMVLLRRLILGLIDEIPGNQSWRFAWKGQNVAVMTLQDGIKEDYRIGEMKVPMHIDWNGVKVGDVSGNAQTNLMVRSESRSNEKIQLKYEVEQAEDVLRMSFYLPQLSTFQGIQGEIRIPSTYDLLEFSPKQLQIKGAEVVLDKDRNSIRWSHALADDIAINGDQAIFHIYITGESSAWEDELVLVEDVLLPELYLNHDAIRFEIVTEKGPEHLKILSQNEPNPWSEETVIQFTIPKEGKVAIDIFDVNGKLAWKHKTTYAGGINEITIKKSDLPSEGVFIYELNYENEVFRKKMIHIKF